MTGASGGREGCTSTVPGSGWTAGAAGAPPLPQDASEMDNARGGRNGLRFNTREEWVVKHMNSRRVIKNFYINKLIVIPDYRQDSARLGDLI
jgi:hypothetical protein